ncbi:hypothetical protein NL676_007887 [Syzygium grande]|nr:hypothetical protein NL676_007887 [Syzygium grande]
MIDASFTNLESHCFFFSTRNRAVGILREKDPALACATASGARVGDNCTTVAETFSLSTGIFADINPNVDCDSLFPGQ